MVTEEITGDTTYLHGDRGNHWWYNLPPWWQRKSLVIQPTSMVTEEITGDTTYLHGDRGNHWWYNLPPWWQRKSLLVMGPGSANVLNLLIHCLETKNRRNVLSMFSRICSAFCRIGIMFSFCFLRQIQLNTFRLIECFTTVFLHIHCGLNWVDEDDDEVCLKENQKTLDTCNKITYKLDPKHLNATQYNVRHTIQCNITQYNTIQYNNLFRNMSYYCHIMLVSLNKFYLHIPMLNLVHVYTHIQCHTHI